MYISGVLKKKKYADTLKEFELDLQWALGMIYLSLNIHCSCFVLFKCIENI